MSKSETMVRKGHSRPGRVAHSISAVSRRAGADFRNLNLGQRQRPAPAAMLRFGDEGREIHTMGSQAQASWALNKKFQTLLFIRELHFLG